jgi:hypothetical protein
MTPKEKANELIDNFRLNVVDYDGNGLNLFKAKQCALIAIDEIVEAIEWHEYETPNKEIRFWIEVKQEIEKL